MKEDNKVIDSRYKIHFAAGNNISQCWSCENCVEKQEVVRPIKDVDLITRYVPLYFPICRVTDHIMLWVYESRCPKFKDSGGFFQLSHLKQALQK